MNRNPTNCNEAYGPLGDQGTTTGSYGSDLSTTSDREVAPQDASHSMNQIRLITIEEVNRGYIVRVGCHTFAIETKEVLVAKLTEYIYNPAATEDKWYAKKLF